MQLEIRTAGDNDLKTLDAFIDEIQYSKDPDYFIAQYEYQVAGDRQIMLGFVESKLVTYCVLNWNPKYGFYKAMGYPEVQDLNVLPAFRGQGIATQMISKCEGLALEKGLTHMGISVGLTASYGPAQRLYVKLGYVPDGYGVTYDRQSVAYGDFRAVDDDLCLMMVKDLQNP